MLVDMAHTARTPVVVGLRTGLHLLFVVLTVLVIARATMVPTPSRAAVIATSIALLLTYVLGGILVNASNVQGSLPRLAWLALVTAEWVVLLWLNSVAAYVVFPLFFLYLHLLGRRAGAVMVLTSTTIAIVVLGVRDRWTVGGVVGPIVGAAVAVMIGRGYQALARESAQRELLMKELISTRDQLVAAEHESGVLAERSRLAREIHDTVAQGLSSIQMLLHAAERADPDRPGIEHIRLARETAATNLADARRFIRELSPPHLDEVGLGGTLRRLADTQWAVQGVDVTVRVSDALALPMHLQTALLRIAQGAMANVIQHAQTTTARITLTADSGALCFTIADEGKGFEPDGSASPLRGGKTDSFGLQATKERVDQLGGTLTIDTGPGRGTVVRVDIGLGDAT